MLYCRALFCVCTDAQALVKVLIQELLIVKNDVGGYKYNTAVTLTKQINHVLKQQLFEESADGMVGLGIKTPNTFTNFKFNVAIKKSNANRQSIDEVAAARSATNIVDPEITTNADAQDEADRQNTARISEISVKEEIVAEMTVIVGKQITNPILRKIYGSDLRTVDEYALHQLLSTFTGGAERPYATSIR